MKAFEEGQKAAMETFDNTVDEELEEFFEERHSGIGGFFHRHWGLVLGDG